jgi:hypothetical protein
MSQIKNKPLDRKNTVDCHENIYYCLITFYVQCHRKKKYIYMDYVAQSFFCLDYSWDRSSSLI